MCADYAAIPEPSLNKRQNNCLLLFSNLAVCEALVLIL